MGKQTARTNLTIPGAIAMILAAAGGFRAADAASRKASARRDHRDRAEAQPSARRHPDVSLRPAPAETLERQQADNFQD